MSKDVGAPAGTRDNGGKYEPLCGFPGCGQTQGSSGCSTHGIGGPPDKDKYDQAGK